MSRSPLRRLGALAGATALTASGLLAGTLGAASAAPVEFEQTTDIVISNNAPAAPYPSSINVSGLSGVITDVTVQIKGFTHTWPADVDVLLVAPDGTNLVLMSDIGGSADVSNVNLTFSDEASGAAPSSQLSSTSYRPTNTTDTIGTDVFPAPAPAPSANITLSAFDGIAPNGTWSLYVRDDAGDDTGMIGAWSLSIDASAIAQDVVFTSTAPTGAQATPNRTYTPTATGGASGNPVTFSIDPSTTGNACSISGGVVSFDNEGTCVVKASQAGGGAYAAGSATQSITVAKLDQTVSFTNTPPAGLQTGDSYQVSTTSTGSNTTVTYAVDAAQSSPSDACSISGTTVTLNKPGTCAIRATKPGNARYNPATAVQSVSYKTEQNLTFTLPPVIYTQTYDLTGAATSDGSNRPITYSVDAARSGRNVCRVVGTTLRFTNAGRCFVVANQAGNATFDPATPVSVKTVYVYDPNPNA